jgi:hypothetical protein
VGALREALQEQRSGFHELRGSLQVSDSLMKLMEVDRTAQNRV